MKTSHIRASVSAASIASCLFLAVGAAGAQSISNTGADSTNVISTTTKCDTKVTNNNDVTVTNNNPQTAVSGDADSDRNTTVGSTTSGSAGNSSEANFSVDVSNTSGGGCQPAPGVTPVATTERPGGRGAGQPAPAPTPAPAPRQVQVTPSGGVGAGAGGPAALGGLTALSLASGAWAVVRLRNTRHQI